MEAKQSEITLTWCGKHKNWWVTNCPDCMVDDNEADIKREGRRGVVEWMKKRMILRTEGMSQPELQQVPEAALLEDGVNRVWDLHVEPKEWQAKLREWEI